jgi:phosphoribosylaminoimidazolecarboxamide formyltransferase/IMP cyclohydrolase
VPEPISRALVSVSDKTGLADLGRYLADRGVEILSTGGTARALAAEGIPAREVSEVTGFPEMLGGRIKTLHPKVHGGILGKRSDPAHVQAMKEHGIGAIGLVVVNLYPFEATVAAGAPLSECVEQIDIGGPAMVRSAAKNYADVTVVVEPDDYAQVMAAMEENSGATTPSLRRTLAAKAFARTAGYDAAVATYFAREEGEALPEQITLSGRRQFTLRYGENPHQSAALYATGEVRSGVVTARKVQGKELSYNNLGDADAAFELAAELDAAAVVIVKHANPSGAAVADSLAQAYRRALACDPVSAFGGIVAVNRTLDRAVAHEIVKLFTEVVIAPDADAAALDVLATKKNLRVLLAGAMPDSSAPGVFARTLSGGMLVQSRDSGCVVDADLVVVTRRPPTDAERRDLLFAWRVCKHMKSNAIVFARDCATTGVGAGQMSRLDSVRIATLKAEAVAKELGMPEPATSGSVLASDAFFPFADGLTAAAEAGATAVIQPGGSVRDDEVIAAADEAGVAMVFTGMRHFRH